VLSEKKGREPGVDSQRKKRKNGLNGPTLGKTREREGEQEKEEGEGVTEREWQFGKFNSPRQGRSSGRGNARPMQQSFYTWREIGKNERGKTNKSQGGGPLKGGRYHSPDKGRNHLNWEIKKKIGGEENSKNCQGGEQETRPVVI